MRTATVADLRNQFPKVFAWIDQGEEVQILRRGHPVARLVPPGTPPSRPVPKIDWKAQRKKLWGDRVFPIEEFARIRAYQHGEIELEELMGKGGASDESLSPSNPS
ncbi:MAG: type II toxin-antitoxin system Phd/YefM family antitoxin [Opitutaceae bacterium]|jgi:antitoxin (DNA-binding transcriptional repressor) of toxin-antitoxin stability system|nr:type II toxin-antitoxin system Phd/YefM family antitoxin [Opitutaceae bacterium]